MTHWGWYWKHKRKHLPKRLCSDYALHEIDSFDLYKNKEGIEWIKKSENRSFFRIYYPFYLEAYIQEDNSIKIIFNDFHYVITVEKKPCNFGGSYNFFHCPGCKKRMRKLYCISGFYLCRKCANLAYYSQRLNPTNRARYMQLQIQKALENRGGSLETKPPWIRTSTFNRARKKYVEYGKKGFDALNNEIIRNHPEKAAIYVTQHYSLYIPVSMIDVYDEPE